MKKPGGKKRGRQVDVKVGPAPSGVDPGRPSRVEARQEEPSPSEFESRRLHQNPGPPAALAELISRLGMIGGKR
jgi:hypothetical protein